MERCITYVTDRMLYEWREWREGSVRGQGSVKERRERVWCVSRASAGREGSWSMGKALGKREDVRCVG